VVRKRSFPPNIKLTDNAKEMFFMVSYNIDKFRAFVFESSFLKRFDIDPEIQEKIKNDDIELLNFGVNWLKDIFFKQTTPEEQAVASAKKNK